MTFLQGTRTHDATLISVIMPTRNRAAYLPDALASVFAQRHQNFELIVIDDGSSDGTPALLAEMNDPRLRVLHTDGVGSSLARNLALDAATGESIVYLDDDNLMDPGWLQAVAWAFDRWPACQVLYGARVLEDHQSASGVPSGEMPSFEWEPFDRRRLEVGNFIDMNVLSHRAGLPEARFDETLESCSDWVLALDLTARHEPLELPAIACVYRAYAPNRLCNSASYLDTHHRVLARVEEAARATTAAPAPACAPAPQPATA
jgi:glycosyltransferase involved in cell wall biosynthesis